MDETWADSRVSLSLEPVLAAKPALSTSDGAAAAKGPAAAAPSVQAANKAQDVASQTALAIINLSREKKQRSRMVKMLGAVTGSDGVPKAIRITSQPKLLIGGTLQAHQMQGLQWLIEGRMTGTGQILADDMGLGKTIQVAAYFAQLLEWFHEDHSSGGVDGLLKHSLNATNGMKQPAQGSALSEEVQSALQLYGLADTSPTPASEIASVKNSSSITEAVEVSRSAYILLDKMRAVNAGVAASLASVAPGLVKGKPQPPSQPRTAEKAGLGHTKAFLRVSPEFNPAAAMVNVSSTPAILCRGSAGPHLVVAPSSTLANWERELNKWCPFLATVIFGGEKASRDAVKYDLQRYNVVITSYANLEGGEGFRTLSKITWATVVVDEAHGAKNAESAKFEGLMRLRVDDGVRVGHRVLLTGTPVQNNLTELITLLRLVMPDLFLIQEDGILKDDEDVGWDEAEVSREGQRAQQLASALQREVDALTRRAKKEAREREKARTSAGAGAGASPSQETGEPEGDTNMSVADILSVYVLRRVKESLQLGLPTKTRHLVWLPLPPSQAGAMHTLVRTLLCLSAGGQPQDSAGSGTLAQSMLVALSSAYPSLLQPTTSGAAAQADVQAMLAAVYNSSEPLVVPDLCEVLSKEADSSSDAVSGGGKKKGKAQDAGASTSASSAPVLLGSSGAIGRLLMLLRKAAIHPLLLRLRYSNEDVLAMAKCCWEDQDEEGEGEEDQEGKEMVKAGQKRTSAVDSRVPHKLPKQAVREPQLLRITASASSSTPSPTLTPIPAPTSTAVVSTSIAEGADEHRQEWVQAITAAHTPIPRAQLLAWAGGDKKLASLAASMLCKSDLELHQEFVQGNTALARRGYDLPMTAYTESNKVQWIYTLLEQLHAKGSRVLLFSQFTQVLDLMEVILQHWGFDTLTGTTHTGRSTGAAMAGYRYGRIDGSTKVTERQSLIDRWSGDVGASVMLLSSKAGGVGINLIAADTVVFLDCDWNPTNDAQAEDRVYRIGQTKPVSIYRLFSVGTIEWHMAAVAEDKTHMASALMKLSERK